MCKFIMLVGLPSSGKSAYATKMYYEKGYTIVSSDSIREELYGDENIQGDSTLVFNEIKNRIKKLLYQDSKNVILDATNISYKRRIQFLKDIKIKRQSIHKECHIVVTPYEECIFRNSKRNRIVPESVIDRMYKQFNVPQYYEGWDNIKIIRNFNDKIEYSIDELFKNLVKIPQDNPYHNLTIGKHCTEAFKNIRSLTFDSDLYLPTLLHDIGKQHCKTFKDSKGNIDSHAHFYGHEFVSAYMSLIYCSYLDDDNLLKVSNYIQWHMRPFHINTDKAKLKFMNLVGEKIYNDLLLIHRADVMSK